MASSYRALSGQEAERNVGGQLFLSLFLLQSGPHARGMVPPTFKVGLPAQLIPSGKTLVETH